MPYSLKYVDAGFYIERDTLSLFIANVPLFDLRDQDMRRQGVRNGRQCNGAM